MIETVKRFRCPRCGYITYDEDKIAWIEKINGKCPACHDGDSTSWTNEYNPKKKRVKRLFSWMN